ncbi:recombinase family protein [Massilia alkalitolerans]|uniref:recombinase family protein n=1 Tax=Massilia alkalitolerans TaxID=286638 RepID=UPI0028A746C6|nr:recombinase family protein [Massilia alkalitolerans]
MSPTAYSYIRWSSPPQGEGHTLERQTDLAEKYAIEKGLTLDTERNMRDEGVSGYSGKNVTDGALGAFLKAIEAKHITPGSFLLVEDIDRLSRLPVMEALAVFQQIIGAGITLVTLRDGQEYSRERLATDWTPLMPILFAMARGHGESERKSDLLGKAWRKKKAAAEKLKPMGDNAPMWLRYVADKQTGIGEYKEIPERVEVVKRIFKMSVDGYGHGAITAILNKEGVPVFKRPGKDTKDNKRSTWGTTSVSRLLGNRAVLGEYQPYTVAGNPKKRVEAGPPVLGYFPSIVDSDLFGRAQNAIASRKINRATKQTKNFNLWAGIGVCAGCGAALTLNTKGVSRLDPDTPLTYLTCSNREKGMCEETGVRLDASERVFAHILATTGNLSLVQDDIALQESQLQAARGRLIAEQSKFDGFIEDYEATGSRAVLGAMTKQEKLVQDTKDEIARLEALLAANTVIDRQAFFNRLDLTNRERRNQANALLKRLDIKVTVKKAGSRSKLAHYAVYQHEKLIMKLRDEAGTITADPFSPDVAWRLYHQGELQDHEMEISVGFGSKKLPKPKKVPA